MPQMSGHPPPDLASEEPLSVEHGGQVWQVKKAPASERAAHDAQNRPAAQV